MVKVTSYYKRSPNGKLHFVSSHNRKVKHNRDDYDIERFRQLSPTYKTGDLGLSYDSRIQAKKPGKRLSANKIEYYERRFDRSDKGVLL